MDCEHDRRLLEEHDEHHYANMFTRTDRTYQRIADPSQTSSCLMATGDATIEKII
jgi:hypothetical protein